MELLASENILHRAMVSDLYLRQTSLILVVHEKEEQNWDMGGRRKTMQTREDENDEKNLGIYRR